MEDVEMETPGWTLLLTKSLQSANKVLWSGVPGLFEESALFLENLADRIPLRLFLLT